MRWLLLVCLLGIPAIRLEASVLGSGTGDNGHDLKALDTSALPENPGEYKDADEIELETLNLESMLRRKDLGAEITEYVDEHKQKEVEEINHGNRVLEYLSEDEEEKKYLDRDEAYFPQELESMSEEIEYTAAAFQYKPYANLSQGGLALLKRNALEFIYHAGLAKAKGAQIIVFPEYALTSTNISPNPEIFFSLTQKVPDPEDEEVPCDYVNAKDSSKIIKTLSCSAKELGMYLVVDLLEQSNCSANEFVDNPKDAGWSSKFLEVRRQDSEENRCKFFNTQVVFDDQGAVVARYRKKHLFLEPILSKGTDPDSAATFKTSFGVTFTLLICFDLIYETPAVKNFNELGVRDALLSTGWMDQLPFLVAPQIWKGFTMGNRVNLVAANQFDPSNGFLGAGIFQGVTNDSEYFTYNTESGNRLIVGKVKTFSAPPSNRTLSQDKETASAPFISVRGTNRGRENSLEVNEELSGTSEFIPRASHFQVSTSQKYKHENLLKYNHSVLEKTVNSANQIMTVCHNDSLCCTLRYFYPLQVDGEEEKDAMNVTYMLLAYSGITDHAGGMYKMYTQNCGLLHCLNENVETCAKVEDLETGSKSLRVSELSGTFKTQYVYPSVLLDNVQLLNPEKWNYSVKQTSGFHEASLEVHEEATDLLAVSLYGRWFSRDPKDSLM